LRAVNEFDRRLYHFDLPPEQIADEPAELRDASRLMLLDRAATEEPGVTHHRFHELVDLLPPRSLLVMNDARVVPARVYCRKPTGGRVELFWLAPTEDGLARCTVRASRRPGVGARLRTERGDHEVELVRDEGAGRFAVRFPEGLDPYTFLEAVGDMPLPPYIRRAAEARDGERYQTVYAAKPGAVAAPTAGLHFTTSLLAALGAAGHEAVTVTLYVGPGTFKPVEVDDVREHDMEGERYAINTEAAVAISSAKATGRPIVAVGTTSVRVLESVADERGYVQAGQGVADAYILPGHRFRVVDHLVTNFHLPSSTLLMLVSALAGRERVTAAYGLAVTEGYRFYSYGDAMFIRGSQGMGDTPT
jgi:S-adenosylmethionine:tRNA ribosyltransferase-isomerase